MGAAAAVVSAVVVDAIVVDAAIAGTLTAFAAVAAVGATIGAIGAVTGNKSLAMAGAAMGIVGGVGALASNAGLIGDGGSLFGTQTAASVSEPGFSGAAGQTLADSMATAPADAAATSSTNFVDALGEAHPEQNLPVTDASANVTTGDTQSIINGSKPEGGLFPDQNAAQFTPGADFNANNPPVIQSGANTSTSIAPVTTDQTNSLINSAPSTGTPDTTGAVTGAPTTVSGGVTGAPQPLTGSPSVPGVVNPGSTTFGQMVPPADTPGMFSKLLDFAKGNQMVTYGIMQSGGSLLAGLTNPVTPAQINALNAQADANRAAANLQNRQAANAGATLPRATRPTTNSPNPAPGS